MTTEERFERIEHITAALAEERKKDREEYKALWRDTQRKIDDFALGMVDLRRQVSELAVETRLRIQEIGDDIKEVAKESRAADQRLESRI